jgi:hypothetical protein
MLENNSPMIDLIFTAVSVLSVACLLRIFWIWR